MNGSDIQLEMSNLIGMITFVDDFGKRMELQNQLFELHLRMVSKRVGAEQTIKKLKEETKCQNK